MASITKSTDEMIQELQECRMQGIFTEETNSLILTAVELYTTNAANRIVSQKLQQVEPIRFYMPHETECFQIEFATKIESDEYVDAMIVYFTDKQAEAEMAIEKLYDELLGDG